MSNIVLNQIKTKKLYFIKSKIQPFFIIADPISFFFFNYQSTIGNKLKNFEALD